MALHLIKLSVGNESASDLERWQSQRIQKSRELMHITRQMPKRRQELLDGGSIYWVIGGFVCARQRLRELRSIMREGVPYCGIIYDYPLVRVRPRLHRPFQGWRYLDPKDAPPDMARGEAELSDIMAQELSALGLL